MGSTACARFCTGVKAAQARGSSRMPSLVPGHAARRLPNLVAASGSRRTNDVLLTLNCGERERRSRQSRRGMAFSLTWVDLPL